MRRFHPLLLATAILALPLAAAAPAMAQVSVDPNALNAIGTPVLPAPPPAAQPRPAHHARPPRKPTHHTPGPEKTQKAAGQTAPAATPTEPAPTPATTGPTEQQKGLGPSFSTLPTLPGAVPALPAKPAPLPPPKTAQPHTAQAPAPAATPANPPGASLALPSGAPPAPTAAKSSPAPAPAPDKPESNALPSGADRITLPYSGQDTALPAAENAMLTGFVQRYGPEAQYSVQAFASVPVGDDDPSTPRRIALDRAREVQSVLVTAGAKPGHIRLIARGNAGGTPPDRVEVVAIPPTPGHTPPSSAP